MSVITFQPNKMIRNTRPSLFDDFFARDLFKEAHTPSAPANIFKTESGFEISLATPGIAKEDISIELKNETLVISHNAKTEKEKNEGKWLQKEFSTSAFSKSFKLPQSVNKKKIEASSENGILTISIPMAKEAKEEPKRIAIA